MRKPVLVLTTEQRGDGAEAVVVFQDVMDPGVELVPVGDYMIPDYLPCDSFVRITLDDRLDPTSLPARTGILYEDNLYLTDAKGNVAFMDCRLRPTTPTAPIRAAHPEYRRVGGGRATHEHMDAGHFGLALGQHPSIAMEQDSSANRYGAWRVFERYCSGLLEEGREVRIVGVFVEDAAAGTYAPFWCIHEEVDGEPSFEYVFTNDCEQ
jgi:hypothetical protein